MPEPQLQAPLARLRDLRRFAMTLVGVQTVDAVARAVMSAGVDAAGAVGGSLMVVSGTRLQLISERDLGDDITAEWSEFKIQPTLDPISDALIAQQPAFYSSRDELFAAYPDIRSTVETTAHHSWVVLPLIHEGQPIGSLGFIYDRPVKFATVEQLALETIADLAAQATIRAISVVEEREAYVSLHAALLDLEIPDLDGVTTSWRHLPATNTANAGGDWFNATALDDGELLFVIGDVAHHGTTAVGEMGRVRAVVLAYALENHPPERIAELTTLTMSKLSSTFATACIVTYDPTSRLLKWTTAGHPYPVIIPASGAPFLLEETHGPPLGVDPSHSYGGAQRVLDPGDTLLLYSDGLIERRDHALDADFDRLLAALDLDLDRPAGLTDTLVDRLHPTGVHDDDIAVLAITVN